MLSSIATIIKFITKLLGIVKVFKRNAKTKERKETINEFHEAKSDSDAVDALDRLSK